MGYSLVYTANAYVNERAVGRAIKDSGVKRENVFLSAKLWPSEFENENAVDETLERLGVDYVDLFYIHQPAGNWISGYRQLEKAYKEGKAKSIGISNFEGKYLEMIAVKVGEDLKEAGVPEGFFSRNKPILDEVDYYAFISAVGGQVTDPKLPIVIASANNI